MTDYNNDAAGGDFYKYITDSLSTAQRRPPAQALPCGGFLTVHAQLASLTHAGVVLASLAEVSLPWATRIPTAGAQLASLAEVILYSSRTSLPLS